MKGDIYRGRVGAYKKVWGNDVSQRCCNKENTVDEGMGGGGGRGLFKGLIFYVIGAENF